MRTLYIVFVVLGKIAIVGNHLASPVERPRGVAGGFRRRLRALSVEEIVSAAA